MSLTTLALTGASRHSATLFLSNAMLDFNSGYRGGSIKPVSGFGNDSLLIVGFFLFLVPLVTGFYYIYKYRALILLRLRHMVNGDKGESSARMLEVLKERRCELEAFTTHKGRTRFVGLLRLAKVTRGSIELTVMSAANTNAGLRNSLATLYFPPTQGEDRVNCFRAVLKSLNNRKIVLGRRCAFGYESRRQHFRADISDPRFVKTRLWLVLPPANGVEKLEETPPILVIDWQKTSGPQAARVKDVSVTGMGILMPLAKRDPALAVGEPVTMQLKVFNRQTKKFRSLWVAGVIRNRINIPNGRLILGIQFTHKGVTNGSSTDVNWDRLDPDYGVPGLAGVLETLSDSSV